MSRPHNSILVEEMLQEFSGIKIKTFYEGTVGAGGHAKALLEAHPEIETYYACDRDPTALEIAEKTLEPFKGKVEWIHGSYSELDAHLDGKKVDGFFLT